MLTYIQHILIQKDKRQTECDHTKDMSNIY